MPIKNTPSRTVELLKSYTPFSTNGETLVESIEDMFSYTITEPLTPVDLQFTFGATNPLVVSFAFKNLTKNATLQVELKYDTKVFDAPLNNIMLEPLQVIQAPLNLRINNMEVGVVKKELDVQISVRNMLNGSLVYSANTEELPIERLSPIVGIYE